MIKNQGRAKEKTSTDELLLGFKAVGMMAWPACAPDALLAWCVVRTGYRAEREVQAELAMAGWSTFLPMETLWVGPARKKRRTRQPLFAGYLFAACPDGGDVAAPAEIRGVVAVRRRGDGRSVVRPRLMLRLMVAETAHAFDKTREKPRPPKHAFKTGDRVKVVDGALTGFEARIEEVLSKREVRASVMLFGRPMEATFATTHLAAA